MEERSVIHPKIRELIQEVFGWVSEEEGRHAGEYPEAYLLSLLENIKERLPEVSAMLYSTVDMARFGDSTEVFQKRLAAVVKKLATAQPNEKVPSREVGKKSLKRRRLEKVGA